jgi:hypothetical protein
VLKLFVVNASVGIERRCKRRDDAVKEHGFFRY